ncbi:MAG: AGE family epimerase/isomerase [Planctomycetes bacterium]|nr:AGE family epimerase/isomerase [Planctomycetota bacterium]
MTPERTLDLIETYRDGLLEDTLAFWLDRCVDREYGGFLHCLDADGSLLGSDKGVWVNARLTWLLARLYNRVERRPEWLALSKHGVDFLLKYAFDGDGRCFYSLTQGGRPLRKRRYLFSEAFVTIALAEYARAAGDAHALSTAVELYRRILTFHEVPGLLSPKVFPETRPSKSHAMPMILLATTQVIREVDDDPLYAEVAKRSANEVLGDFLHRDEKALLETVGPNGERLDGPEGRLVNPGHAIETSWFLMEEGRASGDRALIEDACRILRWSLEAGWDDEFGGILYFVDIEGKPPEPYEHDMKLWWPHTEAIYATLLAYRLTGEEQYLDWHTRVHNWAYSHFPDREHGEWFGYLHRDGTPSSRVKGSMWKGPFHLPRMQLNCWTLLEEMSAA